MTWIGDFHRCQEGIHPEGKLAFFELLYNRLCSDAVPTLYSDASYQIVYVLAMTALPLFLEALVLFPYSRAVPHKLFIFSTLHFLFFQV